MYEIIDEARAVFTLVYSVILVTKLYQHAFTFA